MEYYTRLTSLSKKKKKADRVTPAQITSSLSPAQSTTIPLFKMYNACTQIEPSNHRTAVCQTGNIENMNKAEQYDLVVGKLSRGLEIPDRVFMFWKSCGESGQH